MPTLSAEQLVAARDLVGLRGIDKGGGHRDTACYHWALAGAGGVPVDPRTRFEAARPLAAAGAARRAQREVVFRACLVAHNLVRSDARTPYLIAMNVSHADDMMYEHWWVEVEDLLLVETVTGQPIFARPGGAGVPVGIEHGGAGYQAVTHWAYVTELLQAHIDVITLALAAWNGPTVTNMAPATGGRGGGTAVTIAGTNFNQHTAVSFGSNGPATHVAVNEAGTQITCNTPARQAGAGISAVHVVNQDRRVAYRAATQAAGFTYT